MASIYDSSDIDESACSIRGKQDFRLLESRSPSLPKFVTEAWERYKTRATMVWGSAFSDSYAEHLGITHTSNVSQMDEIMSILKSCIKEETLKPLLDFYVKQSLISERKLHPSWRESWPLNSEFRAAKCAYENIPFHGGADNLILQTMEYYRKKYHWEEGEAYNYSIPIIQSSGSGKTRAVDQASRRKFAFMLNLREPLQAGHYTYPEADENVAQYFEELSNYPDGRQQKRIANFLSALFTRAKRIVSTLKPVTGREELAQKWHSYLRSNKDYFLYHVLTEARRLTSQEFPGSLSKSNEANQVNKNLDPFQYLQRCCDSLIGEIPPRPSEQDDGLGDLAFFLAFDEAHRITSPGNEVHTQDTSSNTNRSVFDNLNSVLTLLNKFSVFTMFMSTNSRLRNMAVSQPLHPSARVQAGHVLFPPITELPIDVFKSQSDLSKPVTLSTAASFEYVVRFGRPLFAAMHEAGSKYVIPLAKAKLNPTQSPKLTDPYMRFSCVATLIQIDLRKKHSNSNTVEAILVERYMRTAFAVPEHRLFMETCTPSEPILAEAAAILLHEISDIDTTDIQEPSGKRMKTDEGSAPGPSNSVLEQQKNAKAYCRLLIDTVYSSYADGWITEGDASETVFRLLCTAANASMLPQPGTEDLHYHRPLKYLDFLRGLIAEEYIERVLDARPVGDSKGATVREAFKHTYVFFSHWAVAGDYEITEPAHFWKCALRGVAIKCQSYDPERDGMMVLIHTSDGTLENSMISRETTSELSYQSKNCQQSTSVLVTPYENPYNKHPTVAFVHELGSDEPGVVINSIPRPKDERYQRHYQITINGASSRVYACLPSDNYTCQQRLRSILQQSSCHEDFPRNDLEISNVFFLQQKSTLMDTNISATV